MKNTFLGIIAIVGLLILGGIAYLAFVQADIPQKEFEVEITPQPVAAPVAPAVIPTPTPVIPTAPIPVPPAPTAEAPVVTAPVATDPVPSADIVPMPAPPTVATTPVTPAE